VYFIFVKKSLILTFFTFSVIFQDLPKSPISTKTQKSPIFTIFPCGDENPKITYFPKYPKMAKIGISWKMAKIRKTRKMGKLGKMGRSPKYPKNAQNAKNGEIGDFAHIPPKWVFCDRD
jgi:hypothetical protein